MVSLLLIASTCQLAIGGLTDIAPIHLMLLQGRITLPSANNNTGGVSFKADPALSSRSYNHSSRPLFGSNVSYAAKQSSRTRYPTYKPTSPQLINSRDVARYTTLRSAGIGWGW